MNIYGIGIDISETERFKKHINDKQFAKKVYGENELLHLASNKFSPERLAAAFSVKEAFGKALGTGVKGFSLTEVETMHKSSGAPFLMLSGNAKKIADELGLEFMLSISHEKNYAVAMVMALKKEND